MSSIPSRSFPYSEEQKQQHVKAWQLSGESKKAYSESHGIRYGTFKDWIYKYQEQRPSIIREPAGNFVSLELNSGAVTGVGYVEIHYPNGSKLIIHKAIPAEELRRLLFQPC